MGKINATGRSKHPHTFFMARHDVCRSPAFKRLSPLARSVWLEVGLLHRPLNNGKIGLSCRQVADEFSVSKDTASRAFNELIDNGLLAVSEDSAFNVKLKKARRWRLTHLPTVGAPPTNEWKKLKDGPITGTDNFYGKIQYDERDSFFAFVCFTVRSQGRSKYITMEVENLPTLRAQDENGVWRIVSEDRSANIGKNERAICGAKTRAGVDCRITSLYPNGRCKFHGGKSTGPKSAEGKARSAQNLPNPK